MQRIQKYFFIFSSLSELPLRLQCELNLSRWRLRIRQLADGTDASGRSVLVEESGIAVATAGLWRNEVGVIGDVKEFGAELDVELFRDPGNRECLV
jgi:hypothetical protein